MTRCASGVFAILTALAACGSDGAAGAPSKSSRPAGRTPAATPAPAAGTSDGEPPTCQPLPFAASTPVPEASGAAWIDLDGKAALLVISDSGNRGAYGIVDPETGATIETGALPLGGDVSDDIEGVAARGGAIYGVTSSGWIRVWRRVGRGFELVGAPYPLGPVDLPDSKSHDRPPRSDGMVCGARAINCGRDYEGLCLAPAPRGPCIGFAAAKADGHLHCITDEAGKLAVHLEPSIAVARPGALADCAFGDDGTLWAGSNLFDLASVYRVAHWDDPVHATVLRVGALPAGFPEGIAARGDVVYRLSDTGGAPSLMARFRCPR